MGSKDNSPPGFPVGLLIRHLPHGILITFIVILILVAAERWGYYIGPAVLFLIVTVAAAGILAIWREAMQD